MEYKDFEVGKTYIGRSNGLRYEATEVTENNVTFKINGYVQKYKKILYCGVYAALYQGNPIILSDKIRPVEDESIEIHPRVKSTKHIFTLNTNGETYVQIFKQNYGKN